MTRNDMIEKLVNNDIVDIKNSMFDNDYVFLYAVLTGNGFTGYNNLTDEQIMNEYNARLDELV